MKENELFFVETQSCLGQLVDAANLVTATQFENMLSLTAEDFTSHEIGVFVTEGLGKGVRAIGYAACKSIFEKTSEKQEAYYGLAEDLNSFGLIGGLYLNKDIRGQGIARQLIEHVTKLTFDRFEDIEACAANCNSLSYQGFIAAGYQPMTSEQQIVSKYSDKTPLVLMRDKWAWHQLYQKMYNREDLWSQ